jgi:hypothetical protein
VGSSTACLIGIETRAGHGMGKPTDKLIAEAADRWAFLVRVLDIDLPAGGCSTYPPARMRESAA